MRYVALGNTFSLLCHPMVVELLPQLQYCWIGIQVYSHIFNMGKGSKKTYICGTWGMVYALSFTFSKYEPYLIHYFHNS